jgi:hypothetical protein
MALTTHLFILLRLRKEPYLYTPLGLLACSRMNFMVPLQMEIIFDINIYFDCLLSHKVFISVIPVFGIISHVMKEEKLGVIFATWR